MAQSGPHHRVALGGIARLVGGVEGHALLAGHASRLDRAGPLVDLAHDEFS
jgi:hypothetical protein